jgi:hypothetical protein
LTLERIKPNKSKFKGVAYGPSIRKGDELLVAMSSGRTAVFIVDKADTPWDPGDQHFIKAHPDHYLDEE